MAYADTVQVQTHSEIETQIVSGTESDTTQTNPHLTTSTGSAGFSAIEQGTASHYTTQTGETLEIDTIQHISTSVNTLTTETFEIYQNQYPTSVNTLTTMEATPDETNQNQPFTNANTLTDTIETNQNQHSGVNVLTIITSVNVLTGATAHDSSDDACPEKR